jgi:hypothetical protein
MIFGSEAACRNPGYDPEWWVHEHRGRCHRWCTHGLAAHICLNHCPLLEMCQEAGANNPKAFDGVVLGGMFWWMGTNSGRRPVTQPPHRERCEACTPIPVS